MQFRTQAFSFFETKTPFFSFVCEYERENDRENNRVKEKVRERDIRDKI